MDVDDAGLREQAREQIRATVYSYLRENRHLEHVVEEVMVELDHYAFALRDGARVEQQEADAQIADQMACDHHGQIERGAGQLESVRQIACECVASAIRAGGETQ